MSDLVWPMGQRHIGQRESFGWHSLHTTCPLSHWYTGADRGTLKHTGHSRNSFNSSVEMSPSFVTSWDMMRGNLEGCDFWEILVNNWGCDLELLIINFNVYNLFQNQSYITRAFSSTILGNFQLLNQCWQKEERKRERQVSPWPSKNLGGESC